VNGDPFVDRAGINFIEVEAATAPDESDLEHMFVGFWLDIFDFKLKIQPLKSDYFEDEGEFPRLRIFVGAVDDILNVVGDQGEFLIRGVFRAGVELCVFLVVEVDVIGDEMLDVLVFYVMVCLTLRSFFAGCFEQSLCSAMYLDLFFGHVLVDGDGDVADGGFLHLADRQGLLLVGVDLAGPKSALLVSRLVHMDIYNVYLIILQEEFIILDCSSSSILKIRAGGRKDYFC
jgi:hypothetical protein